MIALGTLLANLKIGKTIPKIETGHCPIPLFREGTRKASLMANLTNSLAAVMQLPGAIGAAIVDMESGMSLGQAGGGTLNLEVAAAGNTEVVRAKMRVMADLGLTDEIEDILITLGTQYHVIRPLKGKGSAGLFIYVALEKTRANLALSRHKINEIAATLTV